MNDVNSSSKSPRELANKCLVTDKAVQKKLIAEFPNFASKGNQTWHDASTQTSDNSYVGKSFGTRRPELQVETLNFEFDFGLHSTSARTNPEKHEEVFAAENKGEFQNNE